MKWVVALAALLCAAPSAPKEAAPKWSGETPPARFQRTGLVPVVFVPPHQIARACAPVGEVPDDLVIVACTRNVQIGARVLRVVVMPDPCAAADVDPYAQIMCHEVAHLLGGWRHETE